MKEINTISIVEVMALKKKRVSLLTAVIIGFFIPFFTAIMSAAFFSWSRDYLLHILGAWLIIAIPLIITANMVWRCPSCKRMLGSAKDPEACPHCGQNFTGQNKIEEPQQENA